VSQLRGISHRLKERAFKNTGTQSFTPDEEEALKLGLGSNLYLLHRVEKMERRVAKVKDLTRCGIPTSKSVPNSSYVIFLYDLLRYGMFAKPVD
jgi:hypothetical protein